MSTGEIIRLDAHIVDVLSDTAFRAVLANGHRIVAYSASAARRQTSGLQEGTAVTVELSPFDMSAGRIVDVKNDQGVQ